MKKSARKVAKKTATKKAAPRRVLGAKIKVNRKKLAASQVEPGQVPLRTTARIFAQNQAGALGLTLTKPQLRRATDRVEKLFRERGIGGARQVEQAAPVAPVQADISKDRLNPPAALDPSVPQSARPQYARLFPVPDPPRVAPGPATSAPGGTAARRSLDQVVNRLHTSTGTLEEAVDILTAQLGPLLPADFSSAVPPGTSAGYPSPLSNTIDILAARVEGVIVKLLNLRDALAL